MDSFQGDFYDVDYDAIDVDSIISNQIWSLETNASWLNFNSSTGVLNGTPRFNDIGWYNVIVSVKDSDGGSDWNEFILTVLNRVKNNPPTITTTDVEIAKVNESYKVDYNATDDYTPIDLLIWYLKTNASWLNIDFVTGVLSGTPAEDYVGEYWVNITVNDDESGWAFHNFSLRVIKELLIKNIAPELSIPTILPEHGNTQNEFTFSVHYFDADNETPEIIQVVIDGNAYNMILEYGGIAYNGKYEYKTTLSEGVHTYYFTTSDGSDTNISATFSTPYIEKLAEVDGDGTGKEGTSWEWIISGIVIVIIVLLIIVFLIIRRKKQVEQEITPPAEPESSELEEETAPPGPPLTPPPAEEQKTEEPLIQEDIYYTPPQEQETIATTPEDTTLIEPQIQPEALEQPEQPLVEEGIVEEE